MNKKTSVSYDFSGMSVLVTGASKGIGRDIALAFARTGATIAATGRNDSELASLKAEIVACGVSCFVFKADLADANACLAMAEAALKAMGKIDILVNNAGISFPERLIDLDLTHWETTLAVNLRAPALISKVAARDMMGRHQGVIINISSNACMAGINEHAAYCASKFGLDGLTKVMAVELGPHGIRVNAVAPTVVLTPMGTQVWGDPHKSDPVKARIPLGRFLEPREVADLALFLASDGAAMIHGETILLDGGVNALL